MKKRLRPQLSSNCWQYLIWFTTFSISMINITGCGSSSSTDSAASSTALTISGTLKTSSSSALLSALFDLNQTTALTYSDLLVSCVTFTLPPVAGTGGTPDATGNFKVAFGSGTLGKSFGCFITNPSDDTFSPIPMVFKDTSKKSMTGDASKSERLAVTQNITMPEIQLDLDAGTAEVDTSTIVKTDTSDSDVIQTVAGTKFDFTGNWVIETPATNGITVPSGYVSLCSADEAFNETWTAIQTGNWNARKCNGPIAGQKLYMQRLVGRSWTPGPSCLTQVANQDSGQAASLAICDTDGTPGTDERYAIQIWASEGGGGGNLCSPSDTQQQCRTKWNAAQAAVQSPDTHFYQCGRKLGFTIAQAKGRGRVDFSVDPNYSASGSTSGVNDTKYYNDEFNFETSTTLTNSDLYGTCTSAPCKPVKNATSSITHGWLLDQAQTEWPQQNNCAPVDILIGTKKNKAMRCFGNYTPPSASAHAAFNEFIDGGCTDARGKAILFNNQNEFWCSPSDTGCTNSCTSAGAVRWSQNGAPVIAGYQAQACSAKQGTGIGSFTPKDDQGQAITGFTAPIQCIRGGGLFNNTTPASPTLIASPNFQNFVPTQSNYGTLCSLMPTTEDRQKLAQLQCYANAWQKVSSSISGCVRKVDFNWGAQNSWEFLSKGNGPSKAQGEVIFELFNYTDSGSGTFSQIEGRDETIQVTDSNGYKNWIPCRINQNETITMTKISDSKLLAEMTTVINLADKGKPLCTAAAENGSIRTGQVKMMFVLSK